MSVDVANLRRSTGYVNFQSHNFFTREDISIDHMPTWETVADSMHGPIDNFTRDMVIPIPLRLWGAYENLPDLFPSYAMDPVPGTSIFGASNTPLAVQARNDDKIIYTRAAIVGLAALYLGVNSDLWAADVLFNAIIGNNMNPEDANAYHQRTTASYSDATAAFAKTNYKRVRYSSAWGAITGFTSMTAKEG